MEGAQSMEAREPSPSLEVLEKPVRRWLTVEYKARILAEADGCIHAASICHPD